MVQTKPNSPAKWSDEQEMGVLDIDGLDIDRGARREAKDRDDLVRLGKKPVMKVRTVFFSTFPLLAVRPS
jgi:hypothetical protein